MKNPIINFLFVFAAIFIGTLMAIEYTNARVSSYFKLSLLIATFVILTILLCIHVSGKNQF